MALILGIDEAGRGPVLGSMVMAGVLMDEKNLYKLDKLKVRDSKLLTPKQREHLFDKIKKISKNYIIVVQPKEIDEALLSDHLNLNWLEAHKSAEIINRLSPDSAIVDCPSSNIKKYEIYLRKLLKNKKIKTIVEHKADYNHKICAAASILAKVTRDREIKKLQEVIPHNIGSGYASDPYTIDFLEKHHEKYGYLIRKTWASYKNLIKAKGQKKLGEF